MPVVEETIVIARPAVEVFAYLVSAQLLPTWDSSMIECEQLGPDPVGVGTRYRGATKVMGRRFDWITEVTDFETDVVTASRSVEGTLTFAVSSRLTVVSGGTSLTYRIEAASGLGGSFGRFMDPIVQKAQAAVVRANLSTLANLLQEQVVA